MSGSVKHLFLCTSKTLDASPQVLWNSLYRQVYTVIYKLTACIIPAGLSYSNHRSFALRWSPLVHYDGILFLVQYLIRMWNYWLTVMWNLPMHCTKRSLAVVWWSICRVQVWKKSKKKLLQLQNYSDHSVFRFKNP